VAVGKARSATVPRRAPRRGGLPAETRWGPAVRLTVGDLMDAGFIGTIDSFQVSQRHCKGWISTSAA
jgi:hypothetical protein